MNIRYTGMILKVAWRNIWRSKTRSLVVIVAVGLGLWAGIFTSSFMYGISEQRLNNIINTQISHIQIHQPGFTADMESRLIIENGKDMVFQLSKNPHVKGVCGRLVAPGMITSATTGTGVVINGIEPEEEIRVTNISEKITEGNFLDRFSNNQIIIGEKLAARLHAKLKTKLVIKMQDVHGDIVEDAFRVSGIFKTNSSKFDEGSVFIARDKLAGMLSIGSGIHEIAIMLKDRNGLEQFKSELQNAYGLLSVESWKDLAPELDYISRIMDQYLRIFMSIILLAMAFGIINTMLMAVLERIREIGMLMAVGMNKLRIFLMIMFETIFLTLTGVPVGLLFSIATINYFGKTGVDLSLFSKGLANFDIDTVVYPTLDTSFYPALIVMVIATAVLSSLYPAYKALSLNPASSIRTS